MATDEAQGQLRWRPVLIFVLVVITMGSSRGQGTCQSRCRSCSGEMADCSRSGLAAPPRQYPLGTRIINIEGNHIRALGSGSFTRQPNIEVLKAAGNRIRRLNNDAFSRPFPGLVTLELSRNRIRRISGNALRNMANLDTLDLSRNQIRSLRRIFHGTPNLYQLKLSRNQIRVLGENDLAPLTTVHSVDLTSNQISTIHPRAFKNLRRLRYLYLNQNPIGLMSAMEIGSQVLQMVDLSHAQLLAVPQPFPASTREMRLDHNLIERVNHTDFLSIQNLQMLTMNDNKLNFFADGALSHLTNLREIWLRNNDLVYIPRNLPDAVGRVVMTANSIQEIETNLFGENSQLASLSVQNNQLNRIQPNTFSGLRFLQHLDFQSNQLTVLETDTFVGLGSLATLMLSNNPLSRIDAGAFSNLANLTTLTLSYVDNGEFDLAYNFLPEMLRLKNLQLFASPQLAQSVMDKLREAGHVTPLSQLETLDVSHSNLETVPSRVRQLFPNIRAFLLDGNPLRCTHSLRWLREWMDEAGSTVQFYQQTEPTCSTPLRLRDRPITSLASNEWGSESEADSPSLTPGGYGGSVANDQPQERRMRGRHFRRTPVKARESGQIEAEGEEGKTEQKIARPMNMVLARGYGLGKRGKRGQAGGPKKLNRKNGKKDKKGKKGRRQGRRGRKGKKAGKGKKKGRKERKNRKYRKNRERKRRRGVTINTRREA